MPLAEFIAYIPLIVSATHRVFIVEREKLQSVVQAINVKDFDLRRAMEVLIEESKVLENLANKSDVYDF